MFQLRSRWTVLTGAVAVGAYFLNNYQIEGLDKLHLRQRTSAEVAARQAQGLDWRDDLLGELNGRIGQSVPVLNSGYPINEPVASLPSAGISASGSPSPFPSTNPAASNSVSIPGTGMDSPPSGLPVANSGTANATTLLKPLLPAASPTDLTQLLSVNEKLAIWAENVSESRSIQTAGVDDGATRRDVIRIASFHIQALGSTKLAKPHVVDMLVRILRRFDLVALQGVQSSRDDILPLLVERLNHSGRTFDYLIGPRVGRVSPQEQYAFIFDTQRLETDRYQLYTVDDPEDLLTFEPLVAWFRAKDVARSEAFTFSLVNVHIPLELAGKEQALLANLIDAIAKDGRGEDDWILAGDFSGGDTELAGLVQFGARMAITGVPTDTQGIRMLDEICFSGHATSEFTGKSGAYDYLRQHNLSIEHAMEISDHLPIWAEFSVLEGGDPGKVAPVRLVP